MGTSTKPNHPRHHANPSNQSPSPTNNKPSYQKVGSNSLKKIKFHSKSCEDASKQERVFRKLDPQNSQHAHKLSQRRKQIGYGKNTISYDMYCKAIPREKRQKRSMITPSTPDHTLDIPNKKWNGMVRSWRVALHRYDPVDLQHSFAAAQETAAQELQKASTPEAMTTKEKEIADSGLVNLLQVTPSGVDDSNTTVMMHPLEFSSPPPTLRGSDGVQEENYGGIISELDQWGAVRQENEDELFFSGEDNGDDDDSDDELL